MERWGFTFPLEGIPLSAHREVLQEAEARGYTDAWTAEVAGTDAFVPLAVAAAWTTRLRLGSAIANVFTRGPALLAMTAEAMAEAAPGRFCLGIGASSSIIVESWNGMRQRRPLERVRETVAFLRGALSGEKVASQALGSQGFRLARRFGPPPPIFIAALRERMLALAGRLADGVILNWLSPDDVPKLVAIVREAARAAGRDPDRLEIACRIFTLPQGSDEAVRATGRWVITSYLTAPVYSVYQEWLGRGEALRPMMEAWQAGDRRAALELIPDRVIEELLLVGSGRERREKLEAYRRSGITLPILYFVTTGQEPREQGAQALAMLRELAPR